MPMREHDYYYGSLMQIASFWYLDPRWQEIIGFPILNIWRPFRHQISAVIDLMDMPMHEQCLLWSIDAGSLILKSWSKNDRLVGNYRTGSHRFAPCPWTGFLNDVIFDLGCTKWPLKCICMNTSWTIWGRDLNCILDTLDIICVFHLMIWPLKRHFSEYFMNS